MFSNTLKHYPIATAMIAMLAAEPAVATVTVDTDWGNGDFDVSYGSTGAAYLSTFLYVGDLSKTDGPAFIAGSTSGLSYQHATSGVGSNLMEVSYSFTNEDSLPWTDLRFVVNVQADGSNSFNDLAEVQWGAKSTGGPDHFQVNDFLSKDLAGDIVANNGLGDSDACGAGSCDVDLALEWDLASLEPGQIWTVTIGLSDDGSPLSDRFLRATSVDTAATELTFSGNATVVPAPGAFLLLASAVMGLTGLRRRRHP